jgi:hypothetical protein
MPLPRRDLSVWIQGTLFIVKIVVRKDALSYVGVWIESGIKEGDSDSVPGAERICI